MVCIILVGAPLSGKSTVSCHLEKHGFKIIKILYEDIINPIESNVVNQDQNIVSHNNKSFKFPFIHFKNDENRDLILHNLDIEILKNFNRNIVIDSLYHSSDIVFLASRPFVFVLGIDASIDQRYSRYTFNSVTPKDELIKLEEFIQSDSVTNYECNVCNSLNPNSQWVSTLNHNRESSHLFKGNIMNCLLMADFVITNMGTTNDLYEQLWKLQTSFKPELRPNFNMYFIQLAFCIAKRSNCIRRRVGAVITKDNKIVATGYNGSPRGYLNCLEGGCERCIDTNLNSGDSLDECLCVHAESNAILQAGFERTKKATIYVTCFPCLQCSKLIIQSKISKLIYCELYSKSQKSKKLLEKCEIEVESYN